MLPEDMSDKGIIDSQQFKFRISFSGNVRNLDSCIVANNVARISMEGMLNCKSMTLFVARGELGPPT